MLPLARELAPWLLLAAGAWFSLLSINALRPLRNPWMVFQSLLAGLPLREAAALQLAWQLPIVAALVWFDALRDWVGIAGIVLVGVAWLGLVLLHIGSLRDATALRALAAKLPHRAPTDAPSDGTRAVALQRYPELHRLFPALAFMRRDIVVHRGIEFCTVEGVCLHVDVFRPREPGVRRPAIVQVHGGAWVSGFKWLQGIPLLGHLAAHGWVGFNVDYRLSPRATFPEHLVDVKRAIAWVREHADEYGVDRDMIVVTGGSAGAHLATLVGLTFDDPRYQPGFESADTSVAAVVAFYGVYDLTDHRHAMPGPFRRGLERLVMKVKYGESPEAFVRASPIEQVRPDAPPFYVVHGAADNVAPVQGARAFVEALREVSRAPVLYLEIPGAGHAFDLVPSLRTGAAVDAVADFLCALDHQRARSPNEGTT